MLNVKNFFQCFILLDVHKSVIHAREFNTTDSDPNADSGTCTVGYVSVWPEGAIYVRNAPILRPHVVKHSRDNVR